MRIILALLLTVGLFGVGGCLQSEAPLEGAATTGLATVGPDVDPGLRAEGEGSVCGTVTDPTPAPLAGVTVFLRVCLEDSAAVAGEHEFQVVTGEDGTYCLADVPAGLHTVIARKMTYERFEAEIEIPSDDTLTLDIVMEPKENPVGHTHRHWNGDGPHGDGDGDGQGDGGND
jgi:hypothetical protein